MDNQDIAAPECISIFFFSSLTGVKYSQKESFFPGIAIILIISI